MCRPCVSLCICVYVCSCFSFFWGVESVCKCACVHVYLCVFVYLCVYVRARMCACVCVHMFFGVYNEFVYVYACIYVYVSVCVYVNVCLFDKEGMGGLCVGRLCVFFF